MQDVRPEGFSFHQFNFNQNTQTHLEISFKISYYIARPLTHVLTVCRL